MTVVELGKRVKRRDPRSLEQATDAGRFFNRMVHRIERDLGGRRQVSRVEGELIRAFCGAAMQAQYVNRQVMLGENSEIDLSGYATLMSTMLRVGLRLGLGRRARDVTSTEPCDVTPPVSGEEDRLVAAYQNLSMMD
jgi:hypothetical protein